jgi:transcription elongation factor Elf1
MSEDQRLEREIACPKCKAKPLLTTSTSDEPVTQLGDFVGRKCASCGHTFDMDDLKQALADAAEEFLKGRFKGKVF